MLPPSLINDGIRGLPGSARYHPLLKCKRQYGMHVSSFLSPGGDDEVVGEEEALPDGLALLVVAAAAARPHAALAALAPRRRLPAAAAAAQDLQHSGLVG